MKTLRAIYYWLLIVKLSIGWIWRVNLGDFVWYRGAKYMVSNGVRVDSWRLDCLENEDGGWVPRAECRKVCTVQNAINSFRSGYRFYMTSWYAIWIDNGIQPWMRACRIW